MDEAALSGSGDVEKDYFSMMSSFNEGLFDQRARATTIVGGMRPARGKKRFTNHLDRARNVNRKLFSRTKYPVLSAGQYRICFKCDRGKSLTPAKGRFTNHFERTWNVN
jgi:hypothetical protein